MSAQPEDEDAWVHEVLGFWFRELSRNDWFRRDDALDAAIRKRFGKLYDKLAALPSEDLASMPQRSLAACIVLDQFPRNMFRGTAAAFATDAKARDVADAAVSKGLDQQLEIGQRVFLYLPFEHSEDAGDQARSVKLCAQLNDPEYTHYALAHQDIIARFGRFPHRNVCLERPSTPAEEDFLRQPGNSF